MEKLARKIVNLRWLIITLVIVLTLFLGFQIRNISIDSDVINSLNDSDPTAQLYKNVGIRFGGNEIGMIVLESDDVFTAEVLQDVKALTDSLRFTEGVSTVTSLTSILDIRSSEYGIEIGNLVDEYNLPTEQADLDTLRKYVLSRELYKGAIVSADGSATVIAFTLFHDADKQAIARGIKGMVEAMELPGKLYYGGLPFLLNDVADLLMTDIGRLLPFAFLAIALLLFISFRSLRGIILPLLSAGISVIWAIGLMALLGYKLTLTASYIPVVLLAVGTAYTIHIVNAYEVNRLNDRKRAVINAMGYTFIPVLLAAITTIIGFISFIFGSYLEMTKEFGIFAAAGTSFALILSIFFIPSILSFLSGKATVGQVKKSDKKATLEKLILDPLKWLIIKHPRITAAVWVLLLLISVRGIFLIKTSVNITSYFNEDNPTRVTENLMQEKFGGSLPVYVVFKGDIQSPEVLKLIARTELFMKEDPNVSVTQSVAALVEQMNDAMGEGKRIPDEKAKIEQLWFLLDGQEIMSQLVTDDLDMAIIQSQFASIETEDIKSFTLKMDQYISENSTDNITVEFTGIPPIYEKLNISLIKSQYSSLLLAIGLVLIIVAMILKSFSKGVLATVPIIVTIVMSLGFMGFTGIPLDIATVLVGSIALGIGIDYSIHVISGINKHLSLGQRQEEAIENTIKISGKAVITNALSVAAGFILLIFSQMQPFRNFGILVAINMFVSSIGALTLLPVLLMMLDKKLKKRSKQIL